MVQVSMGNGMAPIDVGPYLRQEGRYPPRHLVRDAANPGSMAFSAGVDPVSASHSRDRLARAAWSWAAPSFALVVRRLMARIRRPD